MSTLYFDETASLGEAIERIKQQPHTEIELKFAKTSVFWQNPLNEKLLLRLGHNLGKKLSIQKDTSLTSAPPPTDTQQDSSTKQQRRAPKRLPFLLTAGLALVLFVGGGFSYIYFYLPKAEIVLIVEERILEQTIDVLVSPSAQEIDTALGILPGKRLKIQKQETEVFAATGKKEVGEKATGQVTVRNWTDEPITTNAGTPISAKDNPNLTFTLDQEITIPAQQIAGEEGDQRTYIAGKVTVPVTAAEIGDEYNLSADQEFVLDDFAFNNFPVSSETALSGGSREEVAVVSKDDQTRAYQQLLAKISSQAKNNLEESLPAGGTIIPETIENQTLAKKYDKEVDEEASQFHLTLSVQASAVSYNQSQLEGLLTDRIKSTVPSGFTLATVDRKISVKTVEADGEGNYKLGINYKGLVVPSIDEKILIGQLSGKRIAEAQARLNELDNLEEYQVNLWPRLPRILQVIPYRTERIQVKVETR